MTIITTFRNPPRDLDPRWLALGTQRATRESTYVCTYLQAVHEVTAPGEFTTIPTKSNVTPFAGLLDPLVFRSFSSSVVALSLLRVATSQRWGRGTRRKNAPLSLYGLKVAGGGAIDDQPVFFVDATKKYGRIITSFAVVPFALRVARVVNSASLPGLPSSPACNEERFSSLFDAGRSRQIFIWRQPACLARSSNLARNRVTEQPGNSEEEW